MNVQRSLNHLLLSMVATVTVFLLAATYAPSTQAASTEAYQASATTPTVLAWYRGPGYRGYWNGGYRHWYGYRCARVCDYNRWGGVRHCYRRCN